MKTNLLLLFSFLLILTACVAQPQDAFFDGSTYLFQERQDGIEVYASPDGQTMRVEPAGDQTRVTVGEQVYMVTGTQSEMTVTFPDGRELTRQYSQNSAAGLTAPGTEASMDDWNRVDELRQIAFTRFGQEGDGDGDSPGGLRFLLGIAFTAIGALQIINPRLAWKAGEGWKYQNLEPSDAYLAVARVGGVGMVMIGLWLLVFG